MKPGKLWRRLFILALVCGSAFRAQAQQSTVSTYKVIAIDNSFTDWAGVPVAWTNGPGSPASYLSINKIRVCNDANYLYLRFNVNGGADVTPFDGNDKNNVLINGDNDNNTGYFNFAISGLGSEMLIQGGAGYQEKNGAFNEGAIDAASLGWLSAPSAGQDFEMRFSRAVAYPGGGSVITTNTIQFLLETERSDYTAAQLVPDVAQDGVFAFTYTFAVGAAQPGPLAASKSGGNVVITWPGSGTLQSRDSFTTGTWANVPGASSPYSIPTTGIQRYFRLMQ